jgi:iron complex outermembrane receptor protein
MSVLHLRCLARSSAFAASLLLALPLSAQQSTKPDSATKLGSVTVIADAVETAKLPPLQLATLKATAAITARKVDETVNVMDVEDAVKYLPSLYLRKRNTGDTQAVMATRVWGVSSSARSLIFADGVPLSALIANNNNIGGPRWGLVTPTEIERVDVMYGPFSAAYAGNSMGAVVEMTTRMPTTFEGTLTQSNALQAFDLYGTKKNFGTSQSAFAIGNRWDTFSFWASGNYQNSHAQPLTYVTAGTFPAGTTGGFNELNKLGAAANVLGASGLLNTAMTNGKLKLAYDITPTMRASYTFGMWRNDADAGVDPYIQKAGAPTYAGVAGFATGNYQLVQQHSSHSLAIRSDNKRDWDWELVAATYRMDKDQQRSPTTAAATGLSFGSAGRAAVLDGTNWSSLDAKAIWHAGGAKAEHTVSFGVHHDAYALNNPTYNTAEWTAGAFGTVASEGDGKTQTQAVWAQDAWKLTSRLTFTYGGRYETWQAFDGYNANGTTKVTQATTSATKFSPKGIVSWAASADLTVSASLAKAYRFATAGELFQLVTTGATFTSPNPNLKPDNVLAAELRFDRRFDGGSVQLALFQDDVRDAMIAQFLPLVSGSNTLYSYVSNVDKVRARGAELIVNTHGVGLDKLDLSGSITYLDARVLALSGAANATATPGAAVGKFLPNIPDWRASLQASYRATERLNLSLAGRYSGTLYTTLDNADVYPNTYQGFSGWFVADAKAHYRLGRGVALSLGVDNLLNRKYFFFHPFPQRTLVGSLKYDF